MLESVLAVRITSSQKPAIPTVVRLAADDPVTGFVLCDDLAPLYRDEIRSDAGAASPATMRRIADGLRSALSL
jgi:mRNA interferase MazF